MHACIRNSIFLAGFFALSFGVTACGGNEPAERKAFIEFLQTQVLDKPGVHVPKPTEAETKAFGSYAEHYAVITNVATDPEMMAIGGQMAQAIAVGAPRSLQEVLDRQKDIQTLRDSIAKLRGALDQKLSNAEAARDALKQPSDLKAVFAAAFERNVGDPARAFRSTFPIVDEALEGVQKIAEFLNAHRGQVAVSGSNIQVDDPKLRAELDVMLNALNGTSKQLQEAQRRMRVVLTGS